MPNNKNNSKTEIESNDKSNNNKINENTKINDNRTFYEKLVHISLEYVLKCKDNITKFEKKCLYELNEIAHLLANCLKNSNKILICGNGGSASDALHIAAELVGRFKIERKALPCIALNENVSIITALGNDYGYDYVFSRQVEALGKKDDVLIAISTSGNSKNIINALKKAKELELKTIGFTGINGGLMKNLNICDILLCVPAIETSQIQELHIISGHIICKLIEEILFGNEIKM